MMCLSGITLHQFKDYLGSQLIWHWTTESIS